MVLHFPLSSPFIHVFFFLFCFSPLFALLFLLCSPYFPLSCIWVIILLPASLGTRRSIPVILLSVRRWKFYVNTSFNESWNYNWSDVCVCVSVRSCVRAKRATTACVLANNTFCLFGSNTHPHKPSLCHTHAQIHRTDLSSPILFPICCLIDWWVQTQQGWMCPPELLLWWLRTPAPGQAVMGSSPAAPLVNGSSRSSRLAFLSSDEGMYSQLCFAVL